MQFRATSEPREVIRAGAGMAALNANGNRSVFVSLTFFQVITNNPINSVKKH